jgi:membrane-associated protease RseP (regulator of RpoE activity)
LSPTEQARHAETVFARHAQPVRDRYGLHLLLFGLTVLTTTWAGIGWAGRTAYYQQIPAWFDLMGLPINARALLDGLRFSAGLLLFLTVHEFGHYFAARYHRVRASLPYYLPFPFFFGTIGTFGAVIRLREPVPSTRKLFDIGVAGPLAGFVAALVILLLACALLPPPEVYMQGLEGHEAVQDYLRQHGMFPPDLALVQTPEAVGQTPVVGQNLLFWLLGQVFPNVPPMWELYHYPWLFAGWLGLFFTALNMLPIGQLDGGHILYALVGPVWHRRLGRGLVLLLLASGLLGLMHDILLPTLYAWGLWPGRLAWGIGAAIGYGFLHRLFDGQVRVIAPVLLALMLVIALALTANVAPFLGFPGWLVFCILVVFVIRVEHPPVQIPEPLTPGRRWLGLLSLLLFILCFSPAPMYLR